MLSVGAMVDRYEVLSVLGQGGMAVVYRVRHCELGSLHAMKLVVTLRPELQDRLLQEGRIQARLHHPNLVRVHDVLRVEGRPALVMEYVDGPSLDRYVADHAPKLDAIEAIFRGVCAGVAHAHQSGMIHRDLKPANILIHLVDGVPIPKITDFGIAKVVDHGTEGGTSAGIAMGTPRYMAPEQIRDARGVDARADVYALGALLFELLVGRPLTESSDIVAIHDRAMRDEVPDVRSLAPHVPGRLADAVRQALRGDRHRRIPDVATLIRVLDGGPFDPDATADTLVPRADATVDFGQVVPRPITGVPGGADTHPTWDAAPAIAGEPPADLPVVVPVDPEPDREALGPWRRVALIDAYGPIERWHAEHTDGRRGLLKALRGDADRKRIELIKREGRVLRQLHDPAVPRLIDEYAVGSGDGRRLVIVREDPGGVALTVHLDVHRFDGPEAIGRAADLLAILGRLHRLSPPVVHRELTPDHLWVGADGAWRIADFGAVRDDVVDDQVGGQTFVGAWGYMAPEQFAGDAVPATDVYGVGALIVHLLARRAPRTLLDRDGRIAFRAVIADPALGRVLDAMLAPDPSARPTAREAEAALRSLLPKEEPAIAPSAARSSPPDPARPAPSPEAISAPPPERPRIEPEPFHQPPMLAPPPALPIAPPPLHLLATPRIRGLAVVVALFLALLAAVATDRLLDPPLATPLTTPVGFNSDALTATSGVLAGDPGLGACITEYVAREPNRLSPRLDFDVAFPADGAPTITFDPGPFVDDPLTPCVIRALPAVDLSKVPDAGLARTRHLQVDTFGGAR